MLEVGELNNKTISLYSDGLVYMVHNDKFYTNIRAQNRDDAKEKSKHIKKPIVRCFQDYASSHFFTRKKDLRLYNEE